MNNPSNNQNWCHLLILKKEPAFDLGEGFIWEETGVTLIPPPHPHFLITPNKSLGSKILFQLTSKPGKKPD